MQTPDRPTLSPGAYGFLAIFLVIVGIWVVYPRITGSGGTAAEAEPPVRPTTNPAYSWAAPTPTPAPRTYRVRYLVRQAERGTADISVTNETNGTNHVRNYTGDWDLVLTVPDGFYASLIAQINRGNQITCEIYLNGRLWKSATSNGAYAIVSCGGFVGMD